MMMMIILLFFTSAAISCDFVDTFLQARVASDLRPVGQLRYFDIQPKGPLTGLRDQD